MYFYDLKTKTLILMTVW